MSIKINKPKGLTIKIIIAMVVGLILGVLLKQLGPSQWIDDILINGILYAGGKIFIASLNLLVVPLVFVSLVCGTASLEDITKLGRVGGKTIALYLMSTAIAITLALIFAFPPVASAKELPQTMHLTGVVAF